MAGPNQPRHEQGQQPNQPQGQPQQAAPPAPEPSDDFAAEQAKSLGVTPGQGQRPDPDGPDFGAQRYLLWNRWECVGLVRDPTSLWMSPHEPRTEQKVMEEKWAPHLTKDPRQVPGGPKLTPIFVNKPVMVPNPDNPHEKIPCVQAHITPACVPRTLNEAVRKQRQTDREAVMKKQAEARAAKQGLPAQQLARVG